MVPNQPVMSEMSLLLVDKAVGVGNLFVSASISIFYDISLEIVTTISHIVTTVQVLDTIVV